MSNKLLESFRRWKRDNPGKNSMSITTSSPLSGGKEWIWTLKKRTVFTKGLPNWYEQTDIINEEEE